MGRNNTRSARRRRARRREAQPRGETKQDDPEVGCPKCVVCYSEPAAGGWDAACPGCSQLVCAACTLRLVKVFETDDGVVQLRSRCPTCRGTHTWCDDVSRLSASPYVASFKPLLAAAEPARHATFMKWCSDPRCTKRVGLIHHPCENGCYVCRRSTIEVLFPRR